MSYKIKEIYYTLQGEGYHSGRPAVFCRFTGCNLWTGREEDREKAVCKFCDTDFVGMDGALGGSYSAEELVEKLKSCWPDPSVNVFVVFTGGEPLLQLDERLITACHQSQIEIAVETNGTITAPSSIDWICVSPKANAPVVQQHGDELKLVFPQIENQPDQFENLNFDHFYLQPLDGPDLENNTKLTIEYCKLHPKWKLSMQSHKYLNIP